MPQPDSQLRTLDDWARRAALPFDIGRPESLNAAVDRLAAALGDDVRILGFGEPMHGGEDFLLLRNRLFQRLVESHGFTAIAVESSFPRGTLVNDYIAGRGPADFDAVADAGFSHGFGKLEANRELVEWMRGFNADRPDRAPLRFYGFDSPTEMMNTDGPRRLIDVAITYLTAVDPARGQACRQRFEPLLGNDAAWEDPAVMFDPTKGVGLSPAAAALRVELEELISVLRVRRPELTAGGEAGRYLDALRHATLARQMLGYHAALARPSGNRVAELLGLRDLMMADNLVHANECEAGRVLAFAHNSHLKRGRAEWRLGPDLNVWWPAGAHLHATLGRGYAVVGSAVSESDANGIGRPEPGSLEALLTSAPGPARFIQTCGGEGLISSDVASLTTRSGSSANPTYFPLTAASLTDFDWLAVLDSTTHCRGGPAKPQ